MQAIRGNYDVVVQLGESGLFCENLTLTCPADNRNNKRFVEPTAVDLPPTFPVEKRHIFSPSFASGKLVSLNVINNLLFHVRILHKKVLVVDAERLTGN